LLNSITQEAIPHANARSRYFLKIETNSPAELLMLLSAKGRSHLARRTAVGIIAPQRATLSQSTLRPVMSDFVVSLDRKRLINDGT
jgi:hypothetical protein